MSISGIPPFNGFVSKWMVYQGIIDNAGSGKTWVIWLAAAMFGSALTIASFMKLLHSVFLGRRSEGLEKVREVGPSMYLPLLVLASICVLFGVFAFRIPLALFILPYVGGGIAYSGIWGAAQATTLIMIGLLAGLFIYLLTKSVGFRVVDNFVGGSDPRELPRVSGTDFYDTIKDIAPIGRIYKVQETGNFDMYNIGMRLVDRLSVPLKRLHNGVLPTYMVWSLLCMIALFAVLLFR